MPCYSDYQKPIESEKESVRVIGFLREVGIWNDTRKVDRFCGDVRMLDIDTAALCFFLKNSDPQKYSLELQISWRDHQLKRQET